MDIITGKVLTNYQRSWHCPFTRSVYNWELRLEVPEDLTPTEEKQNEASALSLSPYPEGSWPLFLVVTDHIDLLYPKPF